MDDLALRLKSLRNERGLLQLRVTIDTGVNVGRTESGKRLLSVHSAAVLCRYYGISLSELFRGLDLSEAPWE